jgi:signal transduction histidine kinase
LLVLGFSFTRSFILEVKRREQIELLAANLSAANRQLAELNEMKSNFVSIASHQLRAPIGGVRGYMLLMREGDYGKLPRKALSLLDVCVDQIDRLLHVIEMFLNVTRMEAGKITLERADTDLRSLAETAVKDNELAAKNKKLVLTLSMPKHPIVLSVDPGKIREVMFNFIENAIKYTERGRIEVGLERAPDAVIFRVTDTGVGIPPTEVPKLFAKFVRAGGGFRVAHGSGLGLYIAKTMTEAHGGAVFVESAGEEKGSTFGFRLPVKTGRRK